jgi:glycosyltransferase involved in cell wall biosynthesis
MNRDKKTLVILTPGFAKDEADSSCIPTQQSFIRTLNKACPDVNVIILALEYPYSASSYTWFGNSVLSFNGRNLGGLPRLVLRQRVSRTLKKIHAANKIDGLLSFWYGECALAGKKFATKHGIKHYCWMWGQDAKKGNRYVQKLRLAGDNLIVLSDFLQAEFQKNYSIRPQYVIPPGVDLERFPPGEPAKDIDLIAAGSLIPLKCYDLFISIVAEIKKTFPTVRAVLIGDGPERKRLENLIEEFGLESNIILTGELPHPNVLQWMQRSKIFLHPSSYEGFGIVCIEALCAAATVISFVNPMNQPIENWYIARTKEEMIQRAISILQDRDREYKSVVPYTIDQTAFQMAQLFSL